MFRKTTLYLPTPLVLLFVTCLSLAYAQPQYPETIAVLQVLYQDEIKARLSYLAYAQKALSENYPNIAHLFTALAFSESIHARNFNNLLIALGVAINESRKPDLHIFTTKENLRIATEAELRDIDNQYPQFIERIKVEKYEQAIRHITYAWQAEKQHRALIEKIRSATGMLFGVLARAIEKTPRQYFVCELCGATTPELPKDRCSTCENPVIHYHEVEKPK